MCGTEAVHISFPVSALYLQLHGERLCLGTAAVAGTHSEEQKNISSIVSVGAQDATRAEPELLKSFVLDAEACGADRVRIADTVGIATPTSVMNLVSRLKSASPCGS